MGAVQGLWFLIRRSRITQTDTLVSSFAHCVCFELRWRCRTRR